MKRTRSHNKQPSRDEAAKRPRLKPYASPTLIEYGNIAKLTQTGTGSGADGGKSATKMMVCL
jgi:hypothetical protein